MSRIREMIGDFIIKNYEESKIRILNGNATELDKMYVEVIETTLGSVNEEYDVDTMLKEIKVPKLELRVPESWIE